MTNLGFRVPACFTATGQAILAYTPGADATIDTILATSPRADWISRDGLRVDLATVRERGYAATCSGWTNRLNSVAVPILLDEPDGTECIGTSVAMDRDAEFSIDSCLAAADALRVATDDIVRGIAPATN